MTKLEKVSGIYAIRCTLDGKTYIGQSVDIHVRCRQHKNHLKIGRHTNPNLQQAWDKHGPTCFEFVVLETTQDNLTGREQYWLDKMRSQDAAYNVQPIAKDSINHSPHWEETKRLLSQKAKGRRPTPQQLAAVSQSNILAPHRTLPYPELINIYTGSIAPAGDNRAAFSKQHEIENTAFCKMLKGILPHAYGWMPVERYNALDSKTLHFMQSDGRASFNYDKTSPKRQRRFFA